ncbi:hypothetical protein GCM10016234_15990 [Tianweitania populi]|uniref:Uncharacterized protein n=1 Tax=Tianweitania populi TaxID=1607949 RepID=A0A8J3DY91_9HYPH|nr:hypothetical protein GCM10016234_15990 [Tianweitania populi]
MWKAHGGAVEPHVHSVLALSLLYEFAIAQRTAWIDGDALADRNIADACTDRGNFSRRFMSEDHGFTHPNGSEAGMVKIVKVRPANAAGLHTDTHFARSWFANVAFLDPEIMLLVKDNGFHG